MDILQQLQQLDDGSRPIIIAIDGGSGAGKTTLATYIEHQLPNVTLISTEDFIVPLAQQEDTIDAALDWRRLKDQVILPLAKKKVAKYWRYDPTEPTTQQWLQVAPQGIVIIEGSFSTCLALAPYYDLKIWVETPMMERYNRLVEKDGDEMKAYWQEYLPKEAYYIESYLPNRYADVVFAGTASDDDDEIEDVT